MSAIVGIFNRDHLPVDQAHLARMLDTLAHRGPDGAHLWCIGPVGLGHRMLLTTPESLHETLPFVDATGMLAITADARLDNRPELISLLGLEGQMGAELADSQLILAAYKKWGQACPGKLLGAFAFAIWDGRKQHFFCARDHLGIKPFYYYLSDQRFVFATEIKAILSLPGIPCRLNEIRVADHLAPLLEDRAHTFYQDIYRLPPAHQLLIQPESTAMEEFWALDPSNEIRFATDADYDEAFRELFTEVIRTCLRSAYPIGSQLSGGLDSSAITCVARNLLAAGGNSGGNTSKLKTFSFTFDEDAPCYEVPFINHVLAQNGVTPHFGRGDQSGPLTYIDSFLESADEPFHLPNFFQSWDLFKLIQSQGIRIVLDGFDGDSTISHGWTYLTELAQAGRWRELAAEAEASSRRHQTISSAGLLKLHGIPLLHQSARSGQWLRLMSDTEAIATHFQLARWPLLYRHGLRPALSESLHRLNIRQKPSANRVKEISPFLDDDFMQRTSLIERINELAGARMQAQPTERESHWYALTTGLFAHALEKMDSLAAPFNLDVRHPFMDKRLVEFCLALPPEQKRSQGWDRLILRRALTGILPPEVQWRPGKADFSNNFVEGLIRFDRVRLDKLLLEDELCVSSYVNVDKARNAYRQLIETKKDRDGQAIYLWLVVVLEVWLRRSGISV